MYIKGVFHIFKLLKINYLSSFSAIFRSISMFFKCETYKDFMNFMTPSFLVNPKFCSKIIPEGNCPMNL